MRVLLINLPYYRLMRIKHRYFPVGLGYISAICRSRGYDVMIYNMEKYGRERICRHTLLMKDRESHYPLYIKAVHNDEHYIWNELNKVLDNFNPDVVGVSIWTTVYPLAKKLSRLIKKWKDNAVLVAGGIHATVCDEDIIQNSSFDFVVRGEGEYTFLELLDCITKGNAGIDKIKGITYKDNGVIKRNPPRELINDINSLPFPDKKSLVNPSLYTERDFGCIVTSRGCPYLCSFCGSHNIWGRHVRMRDIQSVFEEIKELYKERRVTFFTFFDDTFTLDRKRIFQLCDCIEKSNMHINWFASGRVDNMDENYVDKLKKGRCFVMQFGVESGSQKLLDKLNKGIELKKVLFVRDIFKKKKILFWATFLMGHPQETESSLEDTYEFIKKLHPDIINVNVFIPYPGSKDWDSLFNGTKRIEWELFSPQSPYAKFNDIEDSRWRYWRRRIELLADKFNRRTQNSIGWFSKLYVPKFIRAVKVFRW